jgi:aminopeptidase N
MLCCCALQAQVIDVQHLALDLQFDWTKQQAQGKADITINLLQAANTISLDAADLNIHAVTMGNKQLNYHYQSGSNQTKLIIVLDAQYAAGERLQLQISYNTTHVNHADPISISGSFGKGLRFMQPTTTTPLKRKQIWSSGEPDGNAYWFPMYIHLIFLLPLINQ